MRLFDMSTALALVGAINEVVLQAIVAGQRDTLSERLCRLGDPVIDLMDRVMIDGCPPLE